MNSTDTAVVGTHLNQRNATLVAPTTSAAEVFGAVAGTDLALGAIEMTSGTTPTRSIPAVTNFARTAKASSCTPSTASTTRTTSSRSSGSSSSNRDGHGGHFAATDDRATDAAVADFELADLWA